jgi:hypothetical protein
MVSTGQLATLGKKQMAQGVVTPSDCRDPFDPCRIYDSSMLEWIPSNEAKEALSIRVRQPHETFSVTWVSFP